MRIDLRLVCYDGRPSFLFLFDNDLCNQFLQTVDPAVIIQGESKELICGDFCL